jgi:hypothetical protein
MNSILNLEYPYEAPYICTLYIIEWMNELFKKFAFKIIKINKSMGLQKNVK